MEILTVCELEEIGKLFFKKRKELGYSQQEMAKEFHFSRGTYSSLESGNYFKIGLDYPLIVQQFSYFPLEVHFYQFYFLDLLKDHTS